MNRHLTRVATAAIVAMLLGTAVFAGIANARSDLSRLTAATARFHSLVQAKNAGYGQPPAPPRSTSASRPSTGRARWASTSSTAACSTRTSTRPSPRRSSTSPTSTASSTWSRSSSSPSRTAGMPPIRASALAVRGGLHVHPVPNRYDIPAFYSLHVWLWKPNPAGLFMPFNPNASCDGARRPAARRRRHSPRRRSSRRPAASSSTARSGDRSRRPGLPHGVVAPADPARDGRRFIPAETPAHLGTFLALMATVASRAGCGEVRSSGDEAADEEPVVRSANDGAEAHDGAGARSAYLVARNGLARPGDATRRAREPSGRSETAGGQDALPSRRGVDQSTISRLERGILPGISLPRLAAIVAALPDLL